MVSRSVGLLLLLAAFLRSSGLLAAEAAPVVPSERNAEIIQPGDTIRIAVHGADNLSLTIKVPETGRVMYPFLKTLALAGKRPQEVAGAIRDGLKQVGHLTDADVSVYVAELASRSVYIMGAVTTPRKVEFPRTEALRVSQALAAAGGFKPEADWRDIRVMRHRGGLQVLHVNLEDALQENRPASDIELADGDLVFVAAADFVFVFGQVNAPGAYRLPPGVPSTVSRYISNAGGFTRFARSNKVRLTRREAPGGNERVEVLDLRLVIELGKIEEDRPVSPGDIIFVPESIF